MIEQGQKLAKGAHGARSAARILRDAPRHNGTLKLSDNSGNTIADLLESIADLLDDFAKALSEP